MPTTHSIPSSVDVVVCGAGIAGIAAAHRLACHHGVGKVLLVDSRPPLSLTSDKSAECYRNWWPGPDGAMAALMNRSIDLLESLADRTGNAIHLNRRGYIFATADPEQVTRWRALAGTVEEQGIGSMRIHAGEGRGPAYTSAAPEGYPPQPTGCDLMTDEALIQRTFPYVTGRAKGVLHVRRCGSFSGQQLGMLQLEEAREQGAVFLQAELTGIDQAQGRVRAVRLRQGDFEHRIETGAVVLAVGPYLKPLAGLLGVDLPVSTELHLKAAFQDRLGALPREAPMMIWEDPMTLDWPNAVRSALEEDEETRHLTGRLPRGLHARPEGKGDSRNVLVIWNVKVEPEPPQFPVPQPPHYMEVALRGLQAMVPAVEEYLERLPRAVIDGGYYARTAENRPLIGPLPVEGAFVTGAFSGFGLMASSAAGELVAAHVCGDTLPAYAPAFHPARFEDPAYLARSKGWESDGTL